MAGHAIAEFAFSFELFAISGNDREFPIPNLWVITTRPLDHNGVKQRRRVRKGSPRGITFKLLLDDHRSHRKNTPGKHCRPARAVHVYVDKCARMRVSLPHNTQSGKLRAREIKL